MIPLDIIKQHCRIELDDDDALLGQYHDSAFDWVQTWLGRTIYTDAVPDDDEHGIVINPAITNAMLILINHWYDNRDAVTAPVAVSALLQPYRLMGV